MYLFNRIRDQRGFTLLEMLVAMAVLTIGLLGIAAMMITAIQANQQSRRTSIATNLAQQKIEEMRNILFNTLFGTVSDDPTGTTPGPVAGINPVDNGSNLTCAPGGQSGGAYPCGDEDVNNGVWTYTSPYTDPNTNVTFRRVWTVERNPNINGVLGIQADEQRTIRIQAIVSWSDATGKWHKVTTTSIISG